MYLVGFAYSRDAKKERESLDGKHFITGISHVKTSALFFKYIFCSKLL